MTGVMAAQGNASPSPVNVCSFLLEPGNSTRPRSTLCPTRCRRSSNCLPNISRQLKAPAASHSDAGGFNDFEDDIPF